MTKKTMTAYELWSLACSITALLVSIASPFITYHFLQTTVQEQQLQAQALQVSGHIDSYTTSTGAIFEFVVQIENTGKLSVKQVQLIVSGLQADSNSSFVSTFPPVSYKIESTGNFSYAVVLSEPISPGEKLKVQVGRVGPRKRGVILPSAWVRSEAMQISVDWDEKRKSSKPISNE